MGNVLVASVGAGIASAVLGFGMIEPRDDADAGSFPDSATPGELPERVDFNRDIRPLLADRCFNCHGPDGPAREATGGLRLDVPEGIRTPLSGGRFPVVPGDSAASEIIRRLRHADEAERMPPADSNLSVNEAEIALIERWIDQGAEWADHWSYVAPVRPEEASVSDESWVRTPIDAFVLAELEANGLSPSPEADRETLIRRLSLDLTGLPPTPEEIDAFLADEEPGAYERVVDRLLASEHFGERLAVMWLDVARYADTNGYHHDNMRTMWPWRDWVIDAFNQNKPYDVFVTEQLAGDLLPDATPEQIVATGFCRNHPMTDEGGAIDAEYLVEYAADRVSTVSTAFLGLTMSCARCHDHKYDPFTMEDYYGLMSFFNSIEEKGLNVLQEGKDLHAFAPYIAMPTDEQAAELERLSAAIESIRARAEASVGETAGEQAAWENEYRAGAGVAWASTEVVGATSAEGDELTVLEDGTVLATGEHPSTDTHEIRVRTDATGLRLIRLDALTHESIPNGRAGLAGNGNAVLTEISVEAVSAQDPEVREPVELFWGWASLEQENGDYGVLRAIDGKSEPTVGWAIDGHNTPGGRTAMFVSSEPFGFEGGTELVVTLRYESMWAAHALGRVRLALATAEDPGAVFGVSWRGWRESGPYMVGSANEVYERFFGPEASAKLSLDQTFGERGTKWRLKPEIVDGASYAFGGANTAYYFARTVSSPVAREVPVSLGSDDAIRVWLNGSELLSNNARRGVGPDQERLTLPLKAGENALVVKVVNDQGPGGFYFRADEPEDWPGEVEPVALVPEGARDPSDAERLAEAFRMRRSPTYRALREEEAARESEIASVRDEVPNVMVMKEMPEPRPTYVLSRGAYDHPDTDRPVGREAPAVLGAMGEDLPDDRLGLAMWLMNDENPLASRVAANRFWQMIFGTGIVRTLEDFGTQGEWPSHPELLDWLAVEFRESGWDVKGLIRLIVTSSVYRQASAFRSELAEADPENRLLGRYPRRRLGAEVLRDLALGASGLLNRSIGGPSVKNYQPDGLWLERSMPNSDTRNFVRDDGELLYRRGMYTFWKRSAPPPQMAVFDAPEREFCVVRRGVTNTPLQALVLLNDETYVEIARALAERVILEARESGADEAHAIGRAFRLLTGRAPGADEMATLAGLHEEMLERYTDDEAGAGELLAYGASARDESIGVSEHAAMTMVASVILNLDETVTQD